MVTRVLKVSNRVKDDFHGVEIFEPRRNWYHGVEIFQETYVGNGCSPFFADFELLELFFSLVVNTNEEHFDIIPNMLQT